jgi:hypothetical protein
MHRRLMDNWESVSKYGATSQGSNTILITNSTAFVPLESRNQTDVINWYNNLGQLIKSLNVVLVPFEHIEQDHGAHALCPHAVGMNKYDHMGRALHLLLSSKLLPMQVRRDNSELLCRL